MFHKAKEVKPLDDYYLLVEFVTGERKRYDVKPLFDEIPAFKELEMIPGLFARIRVDTGGYGLVWNENLDLAAEEIWERGSDV